MRMPIETCEAAIKLAKEMAELARPHLSGFKVGAVLVDINNHLFGGFNIEFDNYSNTIHAEENAICNWARHSDAELKVLVIYTPTDIAVYPCGMCRQSLYELAGDGLNVLVYNKRGECADTYMKDLLPHGFRLERNP